MRRVTSTFAALIVMALLVAFTAIPALGQGQGNQNGLVNVQIGNVIVQVPIGVAANICGVNANVLAQQERGNEDVACTADADAISEVPAPFLP